jgi:hypothetical protein
MGGIWVGFQPSKYLAFFFKIYGFLDVYYLPYQHEEVVIIVSKVVNHNPINAINPPTAYHFDGCEKTTIIIIWVFYYRFTNIIPPTLIFTTPANSWFQPTRRMGP